MNRRISLPARLAALTLCAALAAGCAAPAANSEATPSPAPTAEQAETVKRSGVGFYFNTVVTVTLYGGSQELLDRIWDACERYENLLSKTVPGSDVDRINRAGGESVTVDPETWEILRRAKEISAMTGGAFSVTIAPLTAMWDFTGGTERMPADEERLAALPLVDDQKISLGEDCTVTLPEGMQIDLGGIAKGYIADQVAGMVRGEVSGAVLSFGGNVYVVGHKPDGSASFRVGIQDPEGQTGSVLGILSTTDRSVVTSGIYERQFVKDGVTYHHILDPETGMPSQSDLASATVVSESSMTADALATALIVLGREKAMALLDEAGLNGVLITRDREVYVHSAGEGFTLEVQPGVTVY